MNIQLRPSLNILNLVSKIERIAGKYSELQNNSCIEPKRLATAQEERINFALSLDSTLTESNQKELAVNSKLFLSKDSPTLSKPIRQSYFELLNLENSLRTENASLNFSTEFIFQTVSPYLIQTRFQELKDWIKTEDTRLNPLIVAAIFHLCFLQLHPFKKANHFFSLLFIEKYLKENSYSFLAYSPLSKQLCKNPSDYFLALKQGERTAFSSWATLNIWLEYFLKQILQLGLELDKKIDSEVVKKKLSKVQTQIIKVVKTHGVLSRDKIAKETGINVSTIKYNLGILTKTGQLKREGGGRTTSYRIV